jgi:hypothetical protein
LRPAATAAPRGPIIIAPSILSAHFGRLADDARAIEAAGADWIRGDVLDGRFVSNISLAALVGVVESGLFIGLASKVVGGGATGVTVLER